MTYQEEIAEFRRRTNEVAQDFRDTNSRVIRIGDLVHYTRERESWESSEYDSIWNKDRWGIIVALVKTAQWDENGPSTSKFDYSVRVNSVNVITARTDAFSRDEWSAEPTSVEVIS